MYSVALSTERFHKVLPKTLQNPCEHILIQNASIKQQLSAEKRTILEIIYHILVFQWIKLIREHS